MPTFALKTPGGNVLRYHEFSEPPPVLAPEKGLVWVQEDPPAPPPPTPEQIIARLADAVQMHLDTTARARGYDGVLSACTYATDTHPTFQAEGQAAVDWRGDVWVKCYQIMAEVQAGTRAIPTDTELIALLPAMVWPA